MASTFVASLREARALVGRAAAEPGEAPFARRLLRDLDQAIAQLEGKEPEKDLVSVVCHDLKDPLASIIMGAGFLKKTIAADDAAGRRVVDAIARSADRMSQVVGDFHDLAKLDTDRLPVDARPCDVVPVLRDALATHQAQAMERDVTLELDLPASPLVASCDRARLVQIISKLVANAIKFSSPGARVTVRAQREGLVVRVIVSDTGRGISAYRLETIFDHSANARRTPRDGPGLGLAIARGLVEAQRGTIAVESHVGKGSSFSFTLPAA
jgi:signal transduction histidine kinase